MGLGALMALHQRGKTGRGQVVDVALYEAVFSMMESMLPEYGFSGLVREESEQAATAFDEVWHLVRASGQEAWAIAGIQETAALS